LIGRLTGRIEMDETGALLVDVSGVAYQLRAPASTLKRLRQGEVATLRVHTIFSQEQLALFGFLTPEELRMFQLLLKVNRVGPTLALAVLGGLGPEGLARALVTDDVDTLTSVDGVGKKTAQRLLLELREKLTEVDALVKAAPVPAARGGPPDARTDALEALVALGYNRAQAHTALDAVVRQGGAERTVQQLITGALAQLSRPF
jgi:holliday junction DNA helicase RuvA